MELQNSSDSSSNLVTIEDGLNRLFRGKGVIITANHIITVNFEGSKFVNVTKIQGGNGTTDETNFSDTLDIIKKDLCIPGNKAIYSHDFASAFKEYYSEKLPDSWL